MKGAAVWVGSFIAAGFALVFLYPDSYQQDGGYHFLFARWAWVHPELMVGVWSRPAFTLLYSLPAQLGYPAAKLFSVLLCAACAWQTWRLAEDLRIARPSLAIPLLVLQPSFFLLCSDTMTEPLFALIFVVGLRLHHVGRTTAGMLVASSLILARPEGFFVGLLWGIWILLDKRDDRPMRLKIPSTLLLACGAFAWWLASWLISGDPLYIKHHWPPDWVATGGPYGSGPVWGYAGRAPEFIGPLFLVPFGLGLALLVSRRKFVPLVSATLVLLGLHSILWSYGGFGSAGYPRYMVCVSPAMALISLEGWNAIADRLAAWVRPARIALGGGVLAASLGFSVIYMDAWVYTRDERLISDAHADFTKSPRPVKRLVWSQAYMAIRFDADPWSAPAWGDREKNLRILRDLPSGTLVCWDAETGPAWYHLRRPDFEQAGLEFLLARGHAGMEGRFVKGTVLGFGGPRAQEVSLFYKP